MAVWYAERTGKHYAALTPKISLCCLKGKIKLPLMLEPPPLIRNLFVGNDIRSSHFLSNVRSYNMFSFTSMGGRVESRSNDGGGPRPLLYPDKVTIGLGVLFRVKANVQNFVSYTYTTLRTNSLIDCPISG